MNIGRPDWKPGEGHRVCSLHFTSDCIFIHNDCRRLKYNAVPTVFSERCMRSSQPADLSPPASPLDLSCKKAATAASPLSTVLQQPSDVVKTEIVTDVPDDRTQDIKTEQISSVDDVAASNNNGSETRSSIWKMDHTYYRRTVRETGKKMKHCDHNYGIMLLQSL